MATIKEDYVSFETAKILKEKGFDVPCIACWYIGSEVHKNLVTLHLIIMKSKVNLTGYLVPHSRWQGSG